MVKRDSANNPELRLFIQYQTGVNFKTNRKFTVNEKKSVFLMYADIKSVSFLLFWAEITTFQFSFLHGYK